MREYYKRIASFFALITLVPLAVGFVSAWAEGVGFFLFFFGSPVVIFTLLIGSIIWFVRGLKLARWSEGRSKKLALLSAAPVLLICTIFAALPLLWFGTYVGSMSRLFANRDHYEAIIAKAQKEQKPAWFKDDNGVTYSVDLGPPIRVAFNPAGMLDNWSGIIFDPTGDVMLAKGFDAKTGRFFAPDRVTKLFEGDLVGCRHLWGYYYRCSFT